MANSEVLLERCAFCRHGRGLLVDPSSSSLTLRCSFRGVDRAARAGASADDPPRVRFAGRAPDRRTSPWKPGCSISIDSTIAVRGDGNGGPRPRGSNWVRSQRGSSVDDPSAAWAGARQRASCLVGLSSQPRNSPKKPHHRWWPPLGKRRLLAVGPSSKHRPVNPPGIVLSRGRGNIKQA
jgi:hypothetical protein